MPLENITNDFNFNPYVLQSGDLGFPFSESYSVLYALKVCAAYRERDGLYQAQVENLEKIIDLEKSVGRYLRNELDAQAAKRQFEKRNETLTLIIATAGAGVLGILLGGILVAILKK